jgi:hypothetical protein
MRIAAVSICQTLAPEEMPRQIKTSPAGGEGFNPRTKPAKMIAGFSPGKSRAPISLSCRATGGPYIPITDSCSMSALTISRQLMWRPCWWLFIHRREITEPYTNRRSTPVAMVLDAPTSSPAVCVADARCGVPGNRDDLVVALLQPDGVVVVKVHDGAQRYAAVEPILHSGIAGVAGDAAL